jgi:hypothetical protein
MSVLNGLKKKRITRNREVNAAATSVIQTLERRLLLFANPTITSVSVTYPTVVPASTTADYVSSAATLTATAVKPSFGDTISTVTFYAEKTAGTEAPSTDYDLGNGSASGANYTLKYTPDSPGSGFAALSYNAATSGTYSIYAVATTTNTLTSSSPYPSTTLNINNAPGIASISVQNTPNPYNLTDTLTANTVFPENSSDSISSVTFYAEKVAGTETPSTDYNLGAATALSPVTYALNFDPQSSATIPTGSYTIYAQAKNSTGSIVSNYATSTLSITAGPAIYSISPSSAISPSNVPVTLTATSVLANSSYPISSVTFYAELNSGTINPGGDINLGTATAGSGTAITTYTDTFTPSNLTTTLTSGTPYTVYALATASTAPSGQQLSNEPTTSLTVYSGAPTISTVSVSPSADTVSTSITLTATNVLTPSGDTISKVAFYAEKTTGTMNPSTDSFLGNGTLGLNNAYVATYTPEVAQTYGSVQTAILPAATYSIYAVATNTAGSTDSSATSNEPKTSLTITNPGIGSVSSSGTIVAPSELVTLTASNVFANGSGYSIQSVKFYAEAVPGVMTPASDQALATATASGPTYTATFSPGSVTPNPLVVGGVYTVYAVATATSGSSTVTLTADSSTIGLSVVNNFVSFTQGTYNTDAVPSGGENLLIGVTRAGNLADTVTVSYSTSDGMSSEIADSLATPATSASGAYTAVTNGTVTFPANATSETITIHVAQPSASQIEDSLFTLALSNPVDTTNPTVPGDDYAIFSPTTTSTLGGGTAYAFIDETPKTFNTGNSANDDVVVEQAGNNVTTTTSENITYLDEYSPSGSLVQSFPLPTAQIIAQDVANGVSTANLPILSDTSGAGEFPTLSQNGEDLVLAGAQAYTSNNYVDLGLVSNNTSGSGLTVNTTNAVNFGSTSIGTIRGVASQNGSTIYYVTSSDGLLQASGTGGATQGFSQVPAAGSKTNLRGVVVDANGDPFISADTSANGSLLLFSPVIPGFSLPINSNPNDPGAVSTLAAPYQFAFASAGATDDTLYVADSGTSPSVIHKFSLVSTSNSSIPVSAIAQYQAYETNSTLPGTWISEGTIPLPSGAETEGLAVDQISPTTVQIYDTASSAFDSSGTLANESILYSFTDTLTPGSPSALSPSGTEVSGSGASAVLSNTPGASLPTAASTISVWHGAAIAPSSPSAPVLTLAPASSNATAGNLAVANGQAVSLTSYATGTPTAQVQWFEDAATGPNAGTYVPVTSTGQSYSTTSGQFSTYTFTATTGLSGAKFEAVWYNTNSGGTTQYSDPDLSGSFNTLNNNGYTTATASQVSTLTVTATPYVASISANGATGHAGGPLAGGTTVTINGSNFIAGDTVIINGSTITPTSISSTAITFTAPAESAGTYDIYVDSNTALGTSAQTANDQFTYVAKPTVTAVSPTSGSENGLTTVTITGTGFISGSTPAVNFVFPSSGGTVAATSIQVISPTQITAVAPAVPGAQYDGATVDVEVTTPVGTSTASSADHYTYNLTTVAAADQSQDGTVATLDDNPIVTYILQRPNDPTSSYTNYEFLIDDSSAYTNPNTSPASLYADSIMVNTSAASLNGYVPTVGDALKISGTVKYANGSIQLPELQSITSVTKVSSGNALPADFDPTITAAQVLATTSGSSQYAAQLVTVTNASLPTAGNVYFGTGNASYGALVDSSDPQSTPTLTNQPGLYYYANSFGVAVDNLDGLQVPTTSATYTGIISYDYGDPVDLLVISVPGNVEHFSDTITAPGGSALPLDTQSTTSENDGLSQVNRGSSIVVNVTRTETGSGDTGTATVNVDLTPDSAIAGRDFTTSATGATTLSDGILQIPVSFTGSATTASVTITTSGSTPGDKLFTVGLANASTTDAYNKSTNTAGYNVAITSSASPIVIADTASGDYSDFAASSYGTYTNEAASVRYTSNSISNNTSGQTPLVAVEGSGEGTAQESFAVLTFNDQGFDPSDILNANGNTAESIDGIELEARLSGKPTGAVNVYITDQNYAIATSSQTATYPGASSSLSFETDQDASDGSSDGVGGTINSSPLGTATGDIKNSEVGDLYLLGSINWTTPTGSALTYVSGAETPFNLTTLDPQGVFLLAKELSQSSPITLVITPEQNTTVLNFDGYSTGNTFTSIEPNLRVDYSTNPLPSWVTGPGVTSNASQAIWIVPTQTFYTTVNATITADPQATDGSLPIIDDLTAATTVSITPPTTTAIDVHIGGVDFGNGADLVVTSFASARTYQDHSVIVVGAANAVSAPMFSITGTSKLDLTSNDMIIHDGSLAAIQALAQEGRNAASNGGVGTGPDGTWNGNGLTSSTAASVDSAAGYEQNVLAVVRNGDLPFGSFPSWTVGSTSVPLSASDIIVKYTYNGDAALEGYVGNDAASVVSTFFSDSATLVSQGFPDEWSYGDFDGGGYDNDNSATVVSSFFGNGGNGSGSHSGNGLPQL